MEQNLIEAQKKHANKKTFALSMTAIVSVVTIIVTNANKVFPNYYFTCVIRAIRTNLEQRKVNTKIAEISYYILNARCEIGDYR